MVTRGGWEYVGSDGRLYKVKLFNFLVTFTIRAFLAFLGLIDLFGAFQTEFIADELGYRPVGKHIHPAFVQVWNCFKAKDIVEEFFCFRWRGKPSFWRTGGGEV